MGARVSVCDSVSSMLSTLTLFFVVDFHFFASLLLSVRTRWLCTAVVVYLSRYVWMNNNIRVHCGIVSNFTNSWISFTVKIWWLFLILKSLVVVVVSSSSSSLLIGKNLAGTVRFLVKSIYLIHSHRRHRGWRWPRTHTMFDQRKVLKKRGMFKIGRLISFSTKFTHKCISVKLICSIEWACGAFAGLSLLHPLILIRFYFLIGQSRFV